jgi:hypothetical protein
MKFDGNNCVCVSEQFRRVSEYDCVKTETYSFGEGSRFELEIGATNYLSQEDGFRDGAFFIKVRMLSKPDDEEQERMSAEISASEATLTVCGSVLMSELAEVGSKIGQILERKALHRIKEASEEEIWDMGALYFSERAIREVEDDIELAFIADKLEDSAEDAKVRAQALARKAKDLRRYALILTKRAALVESKADMIRSENAFYRNQLKAGDV